jgi:phage baseplate assembly protein W
MANNVDVPHFDYPFRFNANGHAAVVEQDSEEDIIACILAIIKTPLGFREDLPDFGIADPLFSEKTINIADIKSALNIWEDRADVVLEEGPLTLDQLVRYVSIQMSLKNA